MTLTSVEEFWLRWWAGKSGRAARMAGAVLLAAEGKEPGNIAYRLKARRAAVDRVLAEFDRLRLAALPQPALMLNELLDAAQVDMAHARHVADGALRLFEDTRAVHQLPSRLQPLLETMALLHNLGLEVDEPQHHIAGRDLLMAMKLAGYSEAAQQMIACAIRFHRKRVRPKKEPLFAALTPAQRTQTLALSALLRIADGLDYSQSQTTRIESITVGRDVIVLHLSGPNAARDGERAIEKADLWTELFGHEWQRAPDAAALAKRTLRGVGPISHVIERALADQLLRWEAALSPAKAGDVAAIKALRAAARRARAALELFRPYLRNSISKPLRRQLKRAESVLGTVRDWDVLLDAAQTELSEAGFIEAWRTERAQALREAVVWLESAEAGELVAAWEAALTGEAVRRKYDTPLAANAELILLAPVGTVRELAAALDRADLETYHRLRRVGIKRCRFALEFLSPALGPEAEVVLKDIVKAQDRLGHLNDAHVARDRVKEWLSGHPDDMVAQDYRQRCETTLQTHLRLFPKDWEPVQPEVLREKLQALLAQF